ncbi:putative ferritin heavy polypeptide-like 19 [Plecturocebus cupreus]
MLEPHISSPKSIPHPSQPAPGNLSSHGACPSPYKSPLPISSSVTPEIHHLSFLAATCRGPHYCLRPCAHCPRCPPWPLSRDCATTTTLTERSPTTYTSTWSSKPPTCTYLSMAFYFDQGDVALEHFDHYFLNQSDEKTEHAQELMRLQNHPVVTSAFPTSGSHGAKLGEQARDHGVHLPPGEERQLQPPGAAPAGHREERAPLCNFLESHFLNQQVKTMEELGGYLSNLRKMWAPEAGLAEYLFDKLTLSHSEKET